MGCLQQQRWLLAWVHSIPHWPLQRVRSSLYALRDNYPTTSLIRETHQMSPKLTIGMATYDDYDGCYFTLQALRMYHVLTDVELLVVDNQPGSAGSETLRNQMAYFMQRYTAGVRYVAAPEVVGTSAPRNLVFEEARGEFVVCMDSHEFLAPGAVLALLNWWDNNRDCRDLIHGPMMMDDLFQVMTHFHDVWRDAMWGTWGCAWEWRDCPLRTTFQVPNFTVLDEGGRAAFYTLTLNPQKLDLNVDVPYSGHEGPLEALGARRLGYRAEDDFQIPGQGLGLFSCRKDAWLGFNPLFRGFGGEEMYIHHKYRRAGHVTRCLGFLKWMHRFGRPKGSTYPLNSFDRVRNYVIGHQELELPLDRVYEHFVHGGRFTQPEWDHLIANPKNPNPPNKESLPKQVLTLDLLYHGTKNSQGSYFKEHMDTIKELASQSETVEEVSRFHDTAIALVAGQPKRMRSHFFGSNRATPAYETLMGLKGNTDWVIVHQEEYFRQFEIEDCDLLLYKTDHCEHNLYKNLSHWAPQVKRWIILHDTVRNSERLDDGSAGYAPAMRSFVRDNPEWFVYRHLKENVGLTVLGRLASDRPTEEIKGVWYPGEGPGTELTNILKVLEIVPNAYCDCAQHANDMDVWGVDGCKERRTQIIAFLKAGFERWGWKEKLAAAATAVTSGLAFKVSWLDPFGDLVDEGIRRAEEKESQKKKEPTI